MATVVAFAFEIQDIERLKITLNHDKHVVLAIANISDLVSTMAGKPIHALLIGPLADENLVQAVHVIIASILSLELLPILMIGKYHDPLEIARLLDLGVDDYMHQSVDMSVVRARLRSHLRRIDMRGQSPNKSSITIDSVTSRFMLNAEVIHITPAEFRILRYLALHSQIWHTSSELFEHIWGKNAEARDEALIRNHIRNLRKRLAQYPELGDLIATRQGRGYIVTKPIQVD